MNPFFDARGITDEQLMDKYVKGDYMAFEALYLRHNEKLYSYISRRVGSPENCDEIFQSTFIKLHRFKDRYDSKHLFLKWLYTIARSELLDFLKKKRIDTISMEPDSFSNKTEEESGFIDMEDCSSLNDNEKTAVMMRFFEDEEYQEISSRLNTSESNARKILSRALGKLRKQFRAGEND